VFFEQIFLYNSNIQLIFNLYVQKLIVLFTLLAAVADCAVIGIKRKAYEDGYRAGMGWVGWRNGWSWRYGLGLVASVDMRVGMYGGGLRHGLWCRTWTRTSRTSVLVNLEGLWWTGSL